MKEKFFSNLIFLITVNLLVKPFYIFGIDRAMQIRVNADCGEGTYGLFFALFNFSYLFYALLDLGLTDYNKRAIARNPSFLSENLPSFLAAKIVLTALFNAVLFLSAWIAGYGSDAFTLLVPLALVQVSISFIYFFRSAFGGLLLFKTDGLFTVLDRMLMILFCVILLWGGVVDKMRIEYFAYAQVAAYGISAIAAGILVFWYGGFPKLHFETARIKAILIQSLPYAILVLMMTIYSRTDSILIERLLPDGEVEADLYARGYRMLDAVVGFALLFAGLLMPLFARMIHHKEPVEELVRISFQTILVFSVTTSVSCFFFREPIMAVLYPNASQPEYAALVFGLLMFTFVNISIVYIFGTLLTANGSLRQLNTIALLSILVNVSLNMILIPHFKALGATITTLFTQGISSIAHIVWAIVIMKLQLGRRMWARIFAYVVTCVLVFWGASVLPGSWFIHYVAACFASLIAAFILHMIDIREIFTMLKKTEVAVEDEEDGEILL